MSTGPPAELAVARARRGDLAAFEHLYRQTVDRVFALLVRLSGDRHLAEELTQEVYLRAWRGLADFRGDAAFSSWLHRVAVNVYLSEQRWRARRPERPLDAVLDGRPETGTAEPAGRVDLERAIARLPQGARTVFVLHDIEGYRHDEIARRIGVAPGTSKAQLSRARRLLREALEK